MAIDDDFVVYSIFSSVYFVKVDEVAGSLEFMQKGEKSLRIGAFGNEGKNDGAGFGRFPFAFIAKDESGIYAECSAKGFDILGEFDQIIGNGKDGTKARACESGSVFGGSEEEERLIIGLASSERIFEKRDIFYAVSCENYEKEKAENEKKSDKGRIKKR